MSIIIENLSYTYSKKTPFEYNALKDISLNIEHGDFFGIIGHTGSGKSTLLSHFNALTRVQSGKMSVMDIDLTKKKIDYKKLRRNVGMVFQYPEYQLFAETVYKDVEFGLKNFFSLNEKKENYLSKEDREKRIKDAISLVGLDYNEVKDKSPFELSGGQKRRVAIAGVIVTKPKILVLDEPTSGLDPAGKREIMELFALLQKKVCPTVVMISHDMNEISKYCNKVAVLNDGKVEKVASPKEIFEDVTWLNGIGLDVPNTTALSQSLNEKGFNVDKVCFSEEELAQMILKQLKQKGDK